ncbi:uncharacterized protein N7518_000789 [Penicillium psychrosexuale]|uniref:uncharacterized protein n=1 Tax=Penicillium psychrosexuale TaxID=1002107 RepID=UPI0025454192|nr:uncharacterized protein N7518_000789 [Penicillium psychrosexuale]KAJ5804486.1 hypothetical protein N7518_000789 [Penicillium psychrosexuale]
MHPSTFGKRVPSSRILLSKNRPPPLKSCLAAADSDRDSPLWRALLHFPDDKCFLERVREIPCRPNRNKKELFKSGRLAETKSFIMYTSNPLGSNQRFLSKHPGGSGPQYATQSPWVSVVRARYLAAKYSSAPRAPRSTPSSDGDVSAHESSFDMSSLEDALLEPTPSSSLHGSSFDMSSLKDALLEPTPSSSLHGSSFDMSSLKDAMLEPTPSSSLHESSFDMSSVIHALPDPDVTFDMSSLADSLPDTNGVASDMSSLMRALPDLDAPSVASSLARAPKSMAATHSRESRKLAPKVHARVVQTRVVQVGPFSATCFINLCGLMVLLGSFFPCLAPAFYAALVLLFIYGTCFF